MNGGAEFDAELEALRARRRQEILTRGGGPRPSEPPVVAGPTDLTASTFSPFLSANPRVVIDVWAPWCGPCRAMAPVLDALARELAPRVRFGKLNADEEPALAGRWGVASIPTLLVFDRGRLVDRIVGALPREVLRARLDRSLGGPAGPGAGVAED